MNDALVVTQAPVIFSHSSARALTPHPETAGRGAEAFAGERWSRHGTFHFCVHREGEGARCLEKGFAEASGGSKLGDDNYDAEYAKYVAVHPKPHSTLADVADHVEHIRKVAGVDHVGLGSDSTARRRIWRSGWKTRPDYPYLLAELVRRGWTDAELVKLARGNLLRASAAQRKPPPGCRRTQRPVVCDDRGTRSRKGQAEPVLVPSVRPAEPEVVPLGRRRDGRRDAGDAVGDAGAGRADTVGGVDG
jgi:membrane dipeptidase